MKPSAIHEPDRLTRYAFGEIEGAQRQAVQDHLAQCQPCDEFVSFVTEFNTALREAKRERTGPPETCPDAALIVALETGELRGETAAHVRAHVLFCAECRREFYALRRLRSPSWARVVIDAVQGALRCASLIGSADLAEPAVVGVRGAEGREREDRVQLEDTATDPDSGETSRLSVSIEAVPGKSEASVMFSASPPRPEWTAELRDADGGEIASGPLSRQETIPGLRYGRYGLKVRKGAETLATFAIEVRERQHG